MGAGDWYSHALQPSHISPRRCEGSTRPQHDDLKAGVKGVESGVPRNISDSFQPSALSQSPPDVGQSIRAGLALSGGPGIGTCSSRLSVNPNQAGRLSLAILGLSKKPGIGGRFPLAPKAGNRLFLPIV